MLRKRSMPQDAVSRYRHGKRRDTGPRASPESATGQRELDRLIRLLRDPTPSHKVWILFKFRCKRSFQKDDIYMLIGEVDAN